MVRPIWYCFSMRSTPSVYSVEWLPNSVCHVQAWRPRYVGKFSLPGDLINTVSLDKFFFSHSHNWLFSIASQTRGPKIEWIAETDASRRICDLLSSNSRKWACGRTLSECFHSRAYSEEKSSWCSSIATAGRLFAARSCEEYNEVKENVVSHVVGNRILIMSSRQTSNKIIASW